MEPDGSDFTGNIDSIFLNSCNERGGSLEWVLSSLTGVKPTGDQSAAMVATPVLDLTFGMTRRCVPPLPRPSHKSYQARPTTHMLTTLLCVVEPYGSLVRSGPDIGSRTSSSR